MKRVVKWFRKTFREMLVSDFERYVRGAKDIHDVERRIRNYHRHKQDRPYV